MKRLCHVTDLVIGAKIDEVGATYVEVRDGSFGFLKIDVPEDAEPGSEVTLILKARVVG